MMTEEWKRKYLFTTRVEIPFKLNLSYDANCAILKSLLGVIITAYYYQNDFFLYITILYIFTIMRVTSVLTVTIARIRIILCVSVGYYNRQF